MQNLAANITISHIGPSLSPRWGERSCGRDEFSTLRWRSAEPSGGAGFLAWTFPLLLMGGVCRVVYAAGGGEPGTGEADARRRAHRRIGHRGEPQPELVGAHGGRRGAVRQEVEPAPLDAVLGLAAGAAGFLTEGLGAMLAHFRRGNDKAWVGTAAGPLRLRGDPALAAPAFLGDPQEVGEAPPPPNDPQPWQDRTYPGYTPSASGSFSANG